MRFLARHMTYANVVATLALFVALGGVSYSAITLPAGSIGTRQLRAGSVTLPKLSFPLGISVGTLPGALTLYYRCPAGPPLASCPPNKAKWVAPVTITLRRPAMVLLVGTARFSSHREGASPPRALVHISSGEQTNNGVVSVQGPDTQLDGSNEPTLPLVGVVHSSAGRHTFVLRVSFEPEAPGTSVTLQAAQLAAIVLPTLR
jgi:hypothetical protein